MIQPQNHSKEEHIMTTSDSIDPSKLIQEDDEHQDYTVDWKINWYGKSPRDAAERIWRDIFGRTETNPDDACVFKVTGPNGKSVIIDLAEEED